jgi:hypothetical protein
MTKPDEVQQYIFDLYDRCEPLRRAVAANDDDAVHDLIEGLPTKDTAWIVVQAFYCRGPGRPVGRDSSQRAYYKRKIELRIRHLKQQWCRANGRQRVTGTAKALAKQIIAEFETRYRDVKAMRFKVGDFVK